MLGEMTETQCDGIRVYTYTAPDDGWRVNTHLIELPTQIIAVDAQYTLRYAREIVDYIRTLGKPITRLYITHYHPDHLLGAAAFAAPLHALAEVKAKIELVGDRVAAEEHAKLGKVTPQRAERPSRIAIPGMEVIEGTRFEFLRLRHAETEDALMIGLPDQRILITQDLIYNAVHAFIGEQAFDGWAVALKSYRALPYDRILPGHGAPGGPELYDAMAQYLTVARAALSEASDPDDLKRRLISAFPQFGGRTLLDHEMRFLFPVRQKRRSTTIVFLPAKEHLCPGSI
jgi:glyoxylase-like metal-dependent hydrolase (beta-lactamase superfamily II)